jgi:hypothetical protein
VTVLAVSLSLEEVTMSGRPHRVKEVDELKNCASHDTCLQDNPCVGA